MAEPDFADPQDLNRYSYVGNNPLSYVDPDGFKKKKKKHLSKREQRAKSLGLNPDKDKYKVGKMSDREYKAALAKHEAASKSKNSTASSGQSGSKYSLAINGAQFEGYCTRQGGTPSNSRNNKNYINILDDNDKEALDFVAENIPVLGDFYSAFKAGYKLGAAMDGKGSYMDSFEELPVIGGGFKSTRMITENSAYLLTNGKIGQQYSLHEYYDANPLTSFISKSTEYLSYYNLVGK